MEVTLHHQREQWHKHGGITQENGNDISEHRADLGPSQMEGKNFLEEPLLSMY